MIYIYPIIILYIFTSFYSFIIFLIAEYLSGIRVGRRRLRDNIFKGFALGIFWTFLVMAAFESTTKGFTAILLNFFTSYIGTIITLLTAIAAFFTAFFTGRSMKELQYSRIQEIETKIFPKYEMNKFSIKKNSIFTNFYYYQNLYNLEIWLMDKNGCRIDKNTRKSFSRLGLPVSTIPQNRSFISACIDFPNAVPYDLTNKTSGKMRNIEKNILNEKVDHVVYSEEGIANFNNPRKPNEFVISFSKPNLKEWPTFILIRFLSEYHNEFTELYELRKNRNYHLILVYRKYPWNDFPWSINKYLFIINDSNITVTEPYKLKKKFKFNNQIFKIVSRIKANK